MMRRALVVVLVAVGTSLVMPVAPAAAEPIGVATTVEGPDDDGGITITVPIDCAGCKGKRGPDGTPLAKYWKRVAETWWNDAFGFFSYKPCYTFKLEIDITAKGADFRGTKDRHVVQVAAAGSTDPPSGFEGTKERNPSKGGRDGTRSFDEHRDGIWTEDISEATIAHEVGHLFGLGDDYEVVSENPRVTRPKQGRQGTLMGDNGAIDPALVDRIGKQVEKLLGDLPCATWEGPVRSTFDSPAPCTGSDEGTITVGVDKKGRASGTVTQSGSGTCPTAPYSGSGSLTYGVTGTFTGDEFRFLWEPNFVVTGSGGGGGGCNALPERPIVVPVTERGTAQASFEFTLGAQFTCEITLERQPDDEPVG